MPPSLAIDPDRFLDLSRSDPLTRAEGEAAWESAYAQLEDVLSGCKGEATLYVVYGIQAGGKSWWVGEALKRSLGNEVFFSGPLPSPRHRQRAVALAKAYGCKAVAIWIKTPMEVCLARNAVRKGRARVPEQVMQHVEESLEPASVEEGFSETIVVELNPDENARSALPL